MSNNEKVWGILHGDSNLHRLVMELKQLPFDIDHVLESYRGMQGTLFELVDTITIQALEGDDDRAKFDFHRALHELLKLRITKHRNQNELSYNLMGITTRMIKAWLENEKRLIDLSEVPELDPEGFKDWFMNALTEHQATNHPLYSFLEQEADIEQFRYFVAQESTIDAEFADLIAMTQMGIDYGPKLGMAHNYWDEMGAGDPEKAHSVMFNRLLEFFHIPQVGEEDLTLESLSCGNLLSVLSLHRCFYYMSIGSLAATEGAVPRRFKKLVRAGRRLSIPEEVLDYYHAHIISDSEHMNDWLERVVAPAVLEQKEAAIDIATGVYLRLNTSMAYCDSILETLQKGLVSGKCARNSRIYAAEQFPTHIAHV
jgi:hypothetical protein